MTKIKEYHANFEKKINRCIDKFNKIVQEEKVDYSQMAILVSIILVSYQDAIRKKFVYEKENKKEGTA